MLSDEWDGPYVHVDVDRRGPRPAPAAEDDFVIYYRSIAGEHPDWADYRAAMTRQGKCLIRLTVDRAGG